MHLGYESFEPWPLEEIENPGVPYSERVVKMNLGPDRGSLRVNESLTLAGIPPETFDYRLGSRSALEWIVDQYQVKGESDPNRADDPRYVIRLIGQLVRVSGTGKLKHAPPYLECFGGACFSLPARLKSVPYFVTSIVPMSYQPSACRPSIASRMAGWPVRSEISAT